MIDNKNKKNISIYLHIPFCIKRCGYCDFTTQTDTSNSLMINYVNHICKEISSYKNKNLHIKTIFFGGGTPSLLKTKYLSKIFETIKDSFTLSDEIETTIEVNPESTNYKKLEEYINIGINRLSIGVQSFDNNILKIIERPHTIETFYNVFSFARKVGFENISIDLIYGLPNQTLEIWKDTVTRAINLNTEHISLYCLELHENTSLFNKVEKQEINLPTEEEILEMFEYAKKTLESSKFRHYEISNFAKEGFEAKHNLSYWKNTEYLGFGVGASSYYEKRRYTNTSNINDYLLKNDFSIENIEKQTFKEELEETIFMNLRLLKDGLDINEINNRFNIDIENYYLKEINELKENNLIIKDENKLKLSTDAIFISNEVFSKFIT